MNDNHADMGRWIGIRPVKHCLHAMSQTSNIFRMTLAKGLGNAECRSKPQSQCKRMRRFSLSLRFLPLPFSV